MQLYSWDERFGSSCLQKSLHLAKLLLYGGGVLGWELGEGELP